MLQILEFGTWFIDPTIMNPVLVYWCLCPDTIGLISKFYWPLEFARKQRVKFHCGFTAFVLTKVDGSWMVPFLHMVHFSWEMKHAISTRWFADPYRGHTRFFHSLGAHINYLISNQSEDSYAQIGPSHLCWLLNLEWFPYFEHVVRTLLNTCLLILVCWNHIYPHTTQIWNLIQRSNRIMHVNLINVGGGLGGAWSFTIECNIHAPQKRRW